MPYVPESNTPDTRAVHPEPPTGDTKRHHVFCDCNLCKVDYEKNPHLELFSMDSDLQPWEFDYD